MYRHTKKKQEKTPHKPEKDLKQTREKERHIKTRNPSNGPKQKQQTIRRGMIKPLFYQETPKGIHSQKKKTDKIKQYRKPNRTRKIKQIRTGTSIFTLN